jgi:hypothetical protein
VRLNSHRPSNAATMPIAAHSIHDGKNEPMTLICGPIIYLSQFGVLSVAVFKLEH